MEKRCGVDGQSTGAGLSQEAREVQQQQSKEKSGADPTTPPNHEGDPFHVK